MVSFLRRMPSGIAGTVARPVNAVVSNEIANTSAPFSAYGLPVAIDASGARPITTGDTAVSVDGVLVRPFPTSGSGLNTALTDTAVPPTNGVLDILQTGFVSVRIPLAQITNATKGSTVFVRVQNGSASNPLGGFEAVTSADVVALNGNGGAVKATFSGNADSTGNVEIVFNI